MKEEPQETPGCRFCQDGIGKNQVPYLHGRICDECCKEVSEVLEVGMDHHGEDDFDAAIEKYQEILSMDEEQAMIHNLVGHAYEDQNKYEEATHHFQRAWKLAKHSQKPHLSYQALYDLGAVYNEMGEYSRAMSVFDEMLEGDPESDYGWFGRGNVHRNRGEYKEAIVCYDNIEKDIPRRLQAFALYYRGRCYHKLGDTFRAIRNYHLSLARKEKDMTIPKVFYYLATAHADMGRYDIAIDYFDDALSKNGRDRETIREKSIAHIRYSEQLEEDGRMKDSKKQLLSAEQNVKNLSNLARTEY